MPCKLRLYTGPHCELCDRAKEIIYATLAAGSYELELIDLSKSDLETKKKFGLRIPVLSKTDAEELAWPFSPDELLSFVSVAEP